MNLFKELKRRNVFRIAGIYAVVAWILMQVAGTLEESLKLPEWFDSVVTAGLMIGFPIALLLAWAFEMTPDGVKRTSEGTDEQLVSTSKIDGLILLGIVAVLALGIWQQMNPKQLDSSDIIDSENDIKAVIEPEEETIQPNSIAVLPFTDLSPNKDQEYFSDGMAEEILNVLAQVKQLKVASRTSAFGFKGQESLGLPTIAQKLNVRHILEGSVRKSGDNIRITAQLIDARNDQHLWSQTYDRKLSTENIFAIQDEISKTIVEKLGIALDVQTVELKKHSDTQDLEAYDLYLRARGLFQGRTQLDKAEEYLLKAVKKDDKFAKAWELLSALPNLLKSYDYSTDSYKTVLEKTDKYANKALLLTPNSPFALAAIASVRDNYAWQEKIPQDYKQIINDLEKSIAMAPNQTSPMNWLGMAYLSVGQLENGLKTFQKCAKIDPFFAPCIENQYDTLEAMGHYDKAWKVFSETQGQGISTGGYWVDYLLLVKYNKRTAFLLMINTPDMLLGWHRQEEVYVAYKNLENDHSKLVDDILQFLDTQQRDISSTLEVFLVPLGAYQFTPSSYVIWNQAYKNYRKSKYFKQQIKGSGVYNYWQKHGYPPQCRPIGEDDFECD